MYYLHELIDLWVARYKNIFDKTIGREYSFAQNIHTKIYVHKVFTCSHSGCCLWYSQQMYICTFFNPMLTSKAHMLTLRYRPISASNFWNELLSYQYVGHIHSYVCYVHKQLVLILNYFYFLHISELIECEKCQVLSLLYVSVGNDRLIHIRRFSFP